MGQLEVNGFLHVVFLFFSGDVSEAEDGDEDRGTPQPSTSGVGHLPTLCRPVPRLAEQEEAWDLSQPPAKRARST